MRFSSFSQFHSSEKDVIIRQKGERSITSEHIAEVSFRGSSEIWKNEFFQKLHNLRGKYTPCYFGNQFSISPVFRSNLNIERDFDNCFHLVGIVKFVIKYMKESSGRIKVHQGILGEPWYPRLFHLGTEIDFNHSSYAYRTL